MLSVGLMQDMKLSGFRRPDDSAGFGRGGGVVGGRGGGHRVKRPCHLNLNVVSSRQRAAYCYRVTVGRASNDSAAISRVA